MKGLQKTTMQKRINLIDLMGLVVVLCLVARSNIALAQHVSASSAVGEKESMQPAAHEITGDSHLGFGTVWLGSRAIL
jgi:hypothetical protein